MSKTELGLIFLPTGILLMCFAALFQLYVMVSETHTLNRFREKKLLAAIAFLFFTFSTGVYLLCPNARKKGILFAIMSITGVTLFVLARMWLPFKK